MSVITFVMYKLCYLQTLLRLNFEIINFVTEPVSRSS